MFIDGRHPCTQNHSDAKLGERLFNYWSRAWTEVRTDVIVTFDNDDIYICAFTQGCAQPGRHFRGSLNSGKSTADNDKSASGLSVGLRMKPLNVRFKSGRVLHLVYVEGVLGEPRDIGAKSLLPAASTSRS
ncbi:hypothetical protein DJFAAGMI_04311 [Comamonas sp. PE63]|uniref:Uncharacterized protein n=1 Tax=Comamonas brasiliensis TaxID=1812482 RepID=A0ABS5LYD8_9BURK|nr:hypothetical protein [Comamonas sp. PE63]